MTTKYLSPANNACIRHSDPFPLSIPAAVRAVN